MNPSEILIPINTPVLDKDGKMVPIWWNFFTEIAGGLSSIDLGSQVTGVLPGLNGGTGIATSAPVTTNTLTVNTSVTPDGGGFKHKRVSTGSVSGTSSALVTVTWTTAFADANYTVVASVLDSTASTSALSVTHIEAQVAASVKIRVANTSGGALTGTLEVIAVHD